MTDLEITHLSVAYRGQTVLEDVNLRLPAGRVIGLMGPNGAGKSTLIKAMLGLVPAQRGWVSYAGRPLAAQRQRIAYVAQRSQIDWDFPATVEDVVLMGQVPAAGWFQRISAAGRAQARQALVQVGMADYAQRRIGQLSGGQQQRVFLARALSQGADLLCLDEPLTGVDFKTQALLFDLFRSLATQGKCVLVIHHDVDEATEHFDQVVLLNRRVLAQGSPQEALRPDFLQQAYGLMAA
ncbi:MAG: metal ABC transporter ATP-binding protein [Gloeomargaritaceae cyanobacterium C42_A2020_066]|nr:metal ABC transporter ATP-binding protein [Gloeomargaritaceae cyanobacterium C42_A2020_066]